MYVCMDGWMDGWIYLCTCTCSYVFVSPENLSYDLMMSVFFSLRA